jgi:hypothetical protein
MPLHDQSASDGIHSKLGMNELAQIYLDCFTMELNRVSQADSNLASTTLQRYQSLVGKRTPYFMFTPTQLTEMSAALFGEASDETFTDFILSLTVSIQAHLLRNGQDLMNLFRDLTDSLTILEENAPREANATSRYFSERFASHDTVLKTLKTNRWLLTVLMGVLFMPHMVTALTEAVKPKSRRKPSSGGVTL